jgi:RNA polymerase sigma factor (sigma-70 family)
VQEAYLRAYCSIAKFRGDARLSTWLTRIVANDAFGRLRKRARRAAILPLHVDDDAARDIRTESAAPAMDRPDNVALRREMRHLIEARIDALPDTYRVVFMLTLSPTFAPPVTRHHADRKKWWLTASSARH